MNFSKRSIWFLSFWLLSVSIQMTGQDSVLVTKNFKFADGVYFDFENLKRNQPDIKWKDLEAIYITNPKTFLTQVEYLLVRNTGQLIDLQSLWGVVIEGIPYVRLEKEALNRPLVSFAGLRVRGKIFYFNYETEVGEKVAIQAINPANGKPFRTGYVEKEKSILMEKMLHWDNGEVQDFSKENFLKWIENDKGLYKSVQEIERKEVQEKLFKSVLIYNDRHPVFIRSGQKLN